MTRANVLVLGLGLALAVAAGVSVYLAVQLARQAAPPAVEVAAVVSAAADIPAGTTFDSANSAALVRMVRVPAAQVDPRALTSPLALLGRTTLAPVRAGEIMLEQHLRPSAGALFAGEDLAARLEPGYVALALPANDAISVAGAVRPMDRVDLIASVPMRQADGTQAVVTQAVVQNARVLAVGGQTSSGQAARSAPSSLTLELSPQDALVVEHLIQANTRMALALRHPDDQPGVETSPVTTSDILRRLSGADARPTATRPSAPAASPVPQPTP